jgi:hypothetical protein
MTLHVRVHISTYQVMITECRNHWILFGEDRVS